MIFKELKIGSVFNFMDARERITAKKITENQYQYVESGLYFPDSKNMIYFATENTEIVVLHDSTKSNPLLDFLNEK